MTTGYCTGLTTLRAALSWRSSIPISLVHPDPTHRSQAGKRSSLRKPSLLPPSHRLRRWVSHVLRAPWAPTLCHRACHSWEVSAGPPACKLPAPPSTQNWDSPQWGPTNAPMQNGGKGLFRGPQGVRGFFCLVWDHCYHVLPLWTQRLPLGSPAGVGRPPQLCLGCLTLSCLAGPFSPQWWWQQQKQRGGREKGRPPPRQRETVPLPS